MPPLYTKINFRIKDQIKDTSISSCVNKALDNNDKVADGVSLELSSCSEPVSEFAPPKDLEIINSSILPSRKINPWFITGLTDADGTFSIIVRLGKGKLYFSGYFEIVGKTNKATIDTFSAIKECFGDVGEIRIRGNTVSYIVIKREDIKRIIKHYDQYPLQTTKRTYYIIFKQSMEILYNNPRLSNEHKNLLLNLKSYFKTGLSDKILLYINQSEYFSLNLSLNLPEYIKPKKLPDEWIAGFVEGDGSFNVSISRDNNRKIKTRVLPEFSIVQLEKDLDILKLIKIRFNVGVISRRSNENVFRLKVNNLNENLNVIAPFFFKHLYGFGKGLDLILWYDILVMMQKKYHLSDSGIKLILEKIELIRKNRI